MAKSYKFFPFWGRQIRSLIILGILYLLYQIQGVKYIVKGIVYVIAFAAVIFSFSMLIVWGVQGLVKIYKDKKAI